MSTEAGGPCGSALSEGLGPNAQLVDRLREWASEPACYEVPPPSLLLEAANEIDRLNAWAVAYYKEMRAAIITEREQARRAVEGLYWMPCVPGRWDETDVAHAEGFNKAKDEALLALGPNARLSGPQRPARKDEE